MLKRVSSIFHLAYPIVIAQIGSIMQGFADTIMVGQYGTPELSASGFVNNVLNFILFFLLGISYATSPVVARYHSQGQKAKVLAAFYDSNVLNLIFGMLASLLLLLVYFRIEWFEQPVELLPLMRPYLLTLLISLPFLALFNSMKQFTDALGDTKSAMWVMIGSNVINIVLNYVFIFLLDFGLTGAGLATLVARFFMPFAMYAAARRTMRKHHLLSSGSSRETSPSPASPSSASPSSATPSPAPSLARPTYKGTLLLLRLGFPISIQLCLEAGSFNICAIFMGWLGATALAAHQVMCTVATVAFMLYYGIGAAAAIRIAHYKGLGDLTEIRKTASAAFLMAFIPGMLIVLAVCLFRHSVVSIFTTSPEVSALFISLLPCFLCYQLGDCAQTIYANALRAIERVKAMMLYAFIAYMVISIPFAYIFAFVLDMGAVGIWWSFPFGLSTAAVCYYLQFSRCLRQGNR